jgi:hypothetical protein
MSDCRPIRSDTVSGFSRFLASVTTCFSFENARSLEAEEAGIAKLISSWNHVLDREIRIQFLQLNPTCGVLIKGWEVK